MEKSSGLDRAFDLIELLASTGAEMSVMEISKALGITRTTVYSMVRTLAARNYIEMDPETKKYAIGYKFMDIGSSYRYNFPFLFVAEKHVAAMAVKWNMKINVCVLRPPLSAIVLLSKDVSLIPRMRIGYILPAHATASGKVLLAYKPEEEVQTMLAGNELNAYTPYTITDKKKLWANLKEVRAQGYGVEIEELAEKHACIAAPIRDISGKVIATVSFSTVLEEMNLKQEALKHDIIFLSKTISSELGCSLSSGIV